MRTTLTLDDDVARLLAEAVHRSRRPFKHVVNDAIRTALGAATPRKKTARFRVVPHESRLLPGIDPGRFNAMADEFEDLAVTGRAAKRARARR